MYSNNKNFNKSLIILLNSFFRSNFAEKGSDCTVLPDLEKLIEDFYCEKKPIATMCMASVLVAKVLKGVKVTLGKDCELYRFTVLFTTSIIL